jgi:4'-phosphopantetheinyl transferase
MSEPAAGGAETAPAVSWIDMDAAAAELDHYWPLLSNDEQARSRTYRTPRDAARFIVRRGQLRKLLALRLGGEPSEITLSSDAFGKLSVPTSPLAFSLSHSRQIALYVFAPDGAIGCDIEWHDPDFASERTAERFFAPEEVTALRRLPPARRLAGFFACWTRKEAYLKALGLGLSVPLDSFAISPDPDRPARFLRGGEGWNIHSWPLLPDFAAALAVDASGRRAPV